MYVVSSGDRGGRSARCNLLTFIAPIKYRPTAIRAPHLHPRLERILDRIIT